MFFILPATWPICCVNSKLPYMVLRHKRDAPPFGASLFRIVQILTPVLNPGFVGLSQNKTEDFSDIQCPAVHEHRIWKWLMSYFATSPLFVRLIERGARYAF